MRMTLTHKFVGSLFVSLIICCAVILYVAIYLMKQPLDAELDTSIRKFQNVIESANKLTETRFAQSALLIAHDGNLARAIVDGNHEEVMRLSRQAMKESGSDFMTVTDSEGKVVGRGHSPKWQDSVLNQETVVMALKGTPAAAIVSGTVVPFTIRASQPVFLDNRVVGTLSIGTSLVTPPYLDWLKKLSGMEVSIYKGDSCVMTTIMRNGERAVGMREQSPEILATVLRQGQPSFSRSEINGVEYSAAWWPMRTADGAIAGMWFVGMPISSLMELESSAILKTVLSGLGVLAVLIIIAVFIGLRISSPMRNITEYIMSLAEGRHDVDLTVRGHDDMGMLADSVRLLVRKQTQLIAENNERAKEAERKAQEAADLEREARRAHEEAVAAQHKGIVDAAMSIEKVVGSLDEAINTIARQVEQSDGALRQAAGRLTETATAMEEMNSTVLEVAKNVGQAADISASARDKAAIGSDVVTQSVAGIQKVHQQSLALKEDMAKLDEHARSIDKIMGVISDIADQTNLLALNAAIEAARAGEAGRGFAVVADEVRKLAEKTMASTSEVGSAIQAIQQSADQSAHQVDSAVRNIAQANESSNRSGEMLNDILQMVEHTADEVRQIAAASEEQSAASEQITRALTEVNEITASTSEAMRTASEGLEILRGRSRELVVLVAGMKRS